MVFEHQKMVLGNEPQIEQAESSVQTPNTLCQIKETFANIEQFARKSVSGPGATGDWYVGWARG